MENCSSTSMRRRFSLPRPATIMAFSAEEWACVDAYAMRPPGAPSARAAKWVMRSRAAINALNVALEAES